MPSIIFRVEQEISADDGHADSDDDENEKDEQHKAVDVVNLVGPEGCEDEIPANEPEID